MLYFLWKFSGTRQDIKKREPAIRLSMLGVLVVCVLNNIETLPYLNLFLITGMMVFFQWFIYKERVVLLMALTLVYRVMLSAADFFSVYMFLLVMDVDSASLFNKQSIARVVTICFSKLISMLFIIAIYRMRRAKGSLLPKYIAVMGGCFVFIFVIHLIMVQKELSYKEMKSVLFLVLLVIEWFIVYFVCKLAENYEQQQKIAFLELRNEMLQKSLDETERVFQLWRASINVR